MQKKRASESAETLAAHRAVESMRSENNRIIYDPYAKLLLGNKLATMINSPFRLWLMTLFVNLKFPGFQGSVLARVRFMNECIKECFSGDYTQLVILGAGYDMSAYCFRDILTGARVFEVDHPDTQKDKLTKIKEKIEEIPDNITYVQVDFDTDNLKESLIMSGYSPSGKTLFILEGLIYFLERESIEQILNFIVENSAQGSKVAFDYFPPEVIDGTSTERLGKEMHNIVKKIGEPYKFGIEADDIDVFLRRHRFTDIKKSSSIEIKNAYFHGDNKKRKVSHLFNFVCAST